MTTHINLLSVLGRELTFAEGDQNFQNLQQAVDGIPANLAATGPGQGTKMVWSKQPYPNASERTQYDKNLEIVSVEDFGAVGDWNGVTGTDDSVALQNAILASLGMTSLTDTPTGQCLFALRLSKKYYIGSSVFCPNGTTLIGTTPPTRATAWPVCIYSDKNIPLLVIGRNLAESVPQGVTFRDFGIFGNDTGSGQCGIQLLQAGSYAQDITLKGLTIAHMGGNGIDFSCSDLSAGEVDYTYFEEVKTIHCGGLGLHIKVGVLNHLNFLKCSWSQCVGGGVFFERQGVLINYTEDSKFDSCTFEGCGTGAPNQYAFQDSRYASLHTFDNCYLEGNGTMTGGAHFAFNNTRSARITNSLLGNTKNYILMQHGGMVTVEGCRIGSMAAPDACFWADGAPISATLESVLTLGRNYWLGVQPATDSVMMSRTNSATTKVAGWGVVIPGEGVNNVSEISPRTCEQMFVERNVDNTNIAVSVGYNKVINLGTVNTGATANIGTYFSGLLLVQQTTSKETALYLLTQAGTASMISTSGTGFVTGTPSGGKYGITTSGGKFVLNNSSSGANAPFICRVLTLDVAANLQANTYEGLFS
jgi:hypothetical protein